MHCPEAAQPTVTFLGVINKYAGELNNGSTLLHYCLQVTAYNSSTRSQHTFPITAYFRNGPRWAKFPLLAPQTPIFVTGHIFGTTKENQQLAVLTDDVHFLPNVPPPIPPTPASAKSKRQRTDRWAQRASPTTPSSSSQFHGTISTLTCQDNPTTTYTDPVTPDHTELTILEDDETSMTWPDTDHLEHTPTVMTRRSRRTREKGLP
jgi:hypothetical protein